MVLENICVTDRRQAHSTHGQDLAGGCNSVQAVDNPLRMLPRPLASSVNHDVDKTASASCEPEHCLLCTLSSSSENSGSHVVLSG